MAFTPPKKKTKEQVQAEWAEGGSTLDEIVAEPAAAPYPVVVQTVEKRQSENSSPAQTEPPAKNKGGRPRKALAAEKTNIRFDPVFLERIDRAADESQISRSAWVRMTLNDALRAKGL